MRHDSSRNTTHPCGAPRLAARSLLARHSLRGCLRVAGLLGLLGSAHAAGIDVTITADNAYSFGYGTVTGLSTTYGNVNNCSAGDIFNCSGGPEVYTGIPSGSANYLYVIAYSDDNNTQGVLAQFVAGTNTVYTGTSAWQVYATGLDYDPVCPAGTGGPVLATINAEIAKANSGTGGAGSSVGWVGISGGAGGTVGCLAIGEANDSASGTFPQVCTTAIAKDARWMWYNPDPSTYANPFASPAPPGEFLIFRLPTSQVTNPQMVGVNKDLQNNTGQTVTGVDILIAGHHDSVSDIFHGTTPSFSVVPEGANDRLRWTGGSIPPLAIIHVGFKMPEPNVTILGVSWTIGTTVVGCARQLNTHYHLLGTQDVRYENNCLDCESVPLYVGNVSLEYYENELDLAAMNGTTPRSPLAIDVIPLAPTAIQPGAHLDVSIPSAPAGARWVVMVWTVSTSPTLAGPGNTWDWVQFAAQTDVGSSPAIGYCEPGTGGVIACPCANPPAGAGRGCDNSAATGGASLVASGDALLGGDTLVLSTAGQRPTGTSVVLQGTSALATGVPFGMGVRCVGGTLKRLYIKSAIGGSISVPGPGDASLSARSAALGNPIGSGEHRFYTVYYRDPIVLGGCAPSATFNATSAADVTWN